MSSLPVKPSVRHSAADWSSSNEQLSAAARQQRHASTAVRQEGRALRDVTSWETAWEQSATRRRLSERLDAVGRLQAALQGAAQEVDAEMAALTLAKQQSEEALAATAAPLALSGECAALRDSRHGDELVHDAVDLQLQSEAELTERVQRRLQQHAAAAFQQLCLLQEVRHQLTSDLQNKSAALDIDTSCLSLSLQSAEISLKTDPTRIPPGSSTVQQWRHFSHNNLLRAQDVLQASQRMREDMSLSRAQLQNELDAQRRATDFSLRKRKHQEEQEERRVEEQIRQTDEELLLLQSSILGLDEDLQVKTASLKLAHSRLETRTSRPGPDLCRDQVQHSLLKEVQQLEAAMTALRHKMADAQNSLQEMKRLRSHMMETLSRKQEAVCLERRSLDTRSRLAAPPSTDRTPVLLVPLMNSSGRSFSTTE